MILARGTHLGRYEILGPLGKGGMGEVYRAKDMQLGREVAVKVLSQHLAEDPDALKRFEREARAVAALSHPNILEIHDSGTDQGVAYAVMELLEGETLRDRMKDSAIPTRKALEITAAVADGLAAAHTKGVVHRDLKPENIFLLKDGRVKILDFGLARWTPVLSHEEVTGAPTKSQVSELGAVTGTVPYMSPEQVRGGSLDARSDIFSLGCILYEMLAGKRPFSGSNAAETTAAILRDDPPKPVGIAPEIERVVERCLEKNVERRFHSAHDLAFALRDILGASGGVPSPALGGARHPRFRTAWIAAVLGLIAIVVGWKMIGLPKKGPGESSLQKIESLAVLPLKNLSGDAKQQYFADGMTEELIAKLARISSLRVISRTSVMEYKDAHKPLPQIAKELNVDAILEGSIMQIGNQVKITAQLIHASSDSHLWAQTYQRNISDVFALQNEVASAIAEQIRIQLTPQEQSLFARARPVQPDAYQAYLRGLDFMGRPERSEENFRQAAQLFQRAVEIDPGFAIAYAELSKSHSWIYAWYDHTPVRLTMAKAAVDRAFELQPGLPEAHDALGSYYYFGFFDYDKALKEYSAAQKYLSGNSTLLSHLAAVSRRQGKFEEAVEYCKKALQSSPRDSGIALDLAVTFKWLRKYSEADRYYDLRISLAPDNPDGYEEKARNYFLWKGDTTGAREILNRAPEKKDSEMLDAWFWLEFYDRRYQAALDVLSSPYADPPGTPLLKGRVYLHLNKPELARASFDTARGRLEKKLRENPDDYELHSVLGIAYGGLGRKEEAIREGKRAVELLPVSKDAVWGPESVENLAFIYALVGEENAAIDQIQYLISIPSDLSVPLLRIDPSWDPLRNNPRFQKLLESS